MLVAVQQSQVSGSYMTSLIAESVCNHTLTETGILAMIPALFTFKVTLLHIGLFLPCSIFKAGRC